MGLFRDTDEKSGELADETLRCEKDLTRDEATIMVESNFQRSRYFPRKKPMPTKCVWKL